MILSSLTYYIYGFGKFIGIFEAKCAKHWNLTKSLPG